MSEEFKTKFTYKLKSPITYMNAGVELQGSTLTVLAPTAKLLPMTCVIENLYTKALTDQQKQNSSLSEEDVNASKQKIEDAEITEKDLINIVNIAISGYPDLEKAYVALKMILSTKINNLSVCMIDDCVGFTSVMWDGLSTPDAKELLALYIVNFIDTFLPTITTSSPKVMKESSLGS